MANSRRNIRSIPPQEATNRLIVPKYRNGTLRKEGDDLPLNIACFHQQTQKNLQLMVAQRFNPSGTSPMFGGTPVPQDGPPDPSDFAKAILANYPNPLSSNEFGVIGAFIDAENAAGNFGGYDEMYILPMNDSDNSKYSPIGNLVGSLVSSPSHVPGSGWTFNGANAISSNFDPNGTTTNWKNRDEMQSIYVVSGGSTGVLSGGFDAVFVPWEISNGGAATLWTAGPVNSSAATEAFFQADTLYTGITLDGGGISADVRLYKAGALAASQIAGSNGTWSAGGGGFFIGAENSFGSPASGFTGTLGFAAFGSGSNMDMAVHNTNVLNLIAGLDGS